MNLTVVKKKKLSIIPEKQTDPFVEYGHVPVLLSPESRMSYHYDPTHLWHIPPYLLAI